MVYIRNRLQQEGGRTTALAVHFAVPVATPHRFDIRNCSNLPLGNLQKSRVLMGSTSCIGVVSRPSWATGERSGYY